MRTAFVVLACVSVGINATPAQAQSIAPSGHGGFHASVGVGYGSAALSCRDCGSSREGNPALMLRFGGAIRPNLVLSGQITGWAKEENDVETTASMVSFVTQWYPRPTNGLYLQGGLGVGSHQESGNVDGYGFELKTTHLGLQAGVGYDVRVSRRVSFTPYADFLYNTGAEAKINGSGTGFNVSSNMIHVGMAFSWRSR